MIWTVRGWALPARVSRELGFTNLSRCLKYKRARTSNKEVERGFPLAGRGRVSIHFGHARNRYPPGNLREHSIHYWVLCFGIDIGNLFTVIAFQIRQDYIKVTSESVSKL